MKSKAGKTQRRNNVDFEKRLEKQSATLKKLKMEIMIEASLERVRTVAMSMRKSDELLTVCGSVFNELRSLGFAGADLRNSQIVINDDAKGLYHGYQYSDLLGGEIAEVPYDLHPVIRMLSDKLRRSKDAFADIEISGPPLDEWKAFVRTFPQKPDGKLESAKELHYYFYSVGIGALGISSFRSLSKENLKILQRLRNVFNLSYQRYTDIARAESQTREARIELALERVRAKAMAMQKSDDLAPAVAVIFEELDNLNLGMLRCGIGILNKEKRSADVWTTTISEHGKAVQVSGDESMDIHPLLQGAFDAWLRQDDFSYLLEGKDLNEYYRALTRVNFRLPESQSLVSETEGQRQYYYVTSFRSGGLFAFRETPFPAEAKSVMHRFADVFNLTYTRFLDLQKAEAQAREAKIEAALEKVRSRTIGMQRSEELKEAATLLFQQVESLGGKALSCGYNIWEEDGRTVVSWMCSPQGGIQPPLRFLVTEDSFYKNFYMAKQRGETLYVEEVSGQKLEDERKYLATVPGFQETVDVSVRAGYPLPTRLIHHLAFFSQGFLMFITLEPCPELWDIFKRFGVVFEQTYTRFLDLQKAEAQAREAQIEAALEKVRGKAMAMHSSGDLSATTSAVFNELRRLGVHPIRAGVALYSKQQRRATFYAATTSSENESLAVFGSPEVSVNPCLEMQFRSWLSKENYFPVLKGKDLEEYYAALSMRPSVQVESGDPFQHEEYGYYLHFAEGNFYAWTETPFSEAEMNILQRFKTIIEITFRRYFELQKAEAQTREAQIEASLERVRSRTLAMQKSDELAETAAVLFRQLITLGIEPNRLYIAIMKDESGNVEFWITDEDGSKVSSAFTANLQHNPSWKKMFEGWKQGEKSITIDMQGEELQEYFKHLSSLNVPFKGGLSQKRRVQSVAYFSRGFIGMASPHEQPVETTVLIERFAAVFNLTFTRFNDLKLAEAQAHQAHLDLIQLQTEKKRAEDALSELNAMQAQLVQQEKLASLGQLTAGIAHEIKNPLNFVNNFSSVSVELIDEVIEEIKNRAPELEKGETPQLLANIKGNLAKIIEHGTRADGIVKSMLQHSRGGGSEIEPTDVNALIKEYVNLAFHGMRAGGSPINVNISLDLDKTIGNVPLKAQDFSRVILNLCQNAFDAMREKQKSGGSDRPPYLPKLSVRSAHDKNRVKIQIEDNGPGIPDAIRDKILQPFFTTKKGTQGTGLGLSISNDIVKAHGGEISIETNDSGGATFTITLPTVTAKPL